MVPQHFSDGLILEVSTTSSGLALFLRRTSAGHSTKMWGTVNGYSSAVRHNHHDHHRYICNTTLSLLMITCTTPFKVQSDVMPNVIHVSVKLRNVEVITNH